MVQFQEIWMHCKWVWDAAEKAVSTSNQCHQPQVVVVANYNDLVALVAVALMLVWALLFCRYINTWLIAFQLHLIWIDNTCIISIVTVNRTIEMMNRNSGVFFSFISCLVCRQEIDFGFRSSLPEKIPHRYHNRYFCLRLKSSSYFLWQMHNIIIDRYVTGYSFSTMNMIESDE